MAQQDGEWFVVRCEDRDYYAGPNQWSPDIRRATWYSPRDQAARVLAQVQDDIPEVSFTVEPVPARHIR